MTWLNQIWKDRNLDAFDELPARSFVDHSPVERSSYRDAYREGIMELFQAFPDWDADVDDLVVDEDNHKVAIRWHAQEHTAIHSLA